MTDTPVVSVVIPLYNKGPYIARALNSVLAQIVQDFEVIVVDDGSTDEGAEVVRGFDDPRIQLIQQENQGVSAARNKGIEAAQAGLIAFLDADDEWLPGFLETILRLRSKFPKAGVYATAYYIMKKNKVGSLEFKEIPPEPWEGIIPRYFLTATSGEVISSSSVCIPKKVFDEIGTFMEGVWWGEDTEMWGRIALYYNIVFTWNYGAIYHHEATNRANERIKLEKDHPFIRVGLDYIKNNKRNISPTHVDDLQEYIELQKLKIAGRALKSGKPKFAQQKIKECKTKSHRKEKNIMYLISCFPKQIYQALRYIKLNLM